LKKHNLIIPDDDITEKIHNKTRKGKKQQPMPKIESSHSNDETPKIMKQERLAIHKLRDMPEMTYFYMVKGPPSLLESATKDIVEEKFVKVHKKERKPRNPKLYINSNRPALEENQEEPALQENQEPVIGRKYVLTR